MKEDEGEQRWDWSSEENKGKGGRKEWGSQVVEVNAQVASELLFVSLRESCQEFGFEFRFEQTSKLVLNVYHHEVVLSGAATQ